MDPALRRDAVTALLPTYHEPSGPKPLRRWEFVLGKWLGMLLTLAVQMGVMGVVLAGTLALQGASLDVPMVKAVWRCWATDGRCRSIGRIVWCVSRWT